MHDPIPVSVLTGFLGAGKTTLLNRLLRAPEMADAAVIINEFGDVSIDHLLVESASDGIIQLADGCLCCTVRGELVDTLSDLVDRVQTGKIARLSRIVVETTGLADPGPVLHAIMGHPVLLQALRLDGVVTVVDALNGSATLDRHAEAVKQVAIADRLVLSKADVAGNEAVARISARVAALNPRALTVDARTADVQALLGCGVYDPVAGRADVERWLSSRHQHDHAHHDGEGRHHHDEVRHDDVHHGDHHHGEDHDHHHAHHDGRIRSHTLIHDRPLSFAAVTTFIDLLRSLHGENMLRMKGIVELAEDPERPLVIHGVQSIFHPPARLPAWPDGRRGARIVLITFDLPGDYVERLFRAVSGRPSVDEPDRAALAENPLAIGGIRLG